MKQSAIEKELLTFLLNFRYWLRSHDRGVIIGVIMGFVPIVPITTIGLLLCLVNLYLLKSHRLDANESRLIKIGLFISTTNLILGFLLALYLFKSFSTVHWLEVFEMLKNNLNHLANSIKSLFNSNSVINNSPINQTNYM